MARRGTNVSSPFATAADWSDNHLSWWYGTHFAEPGIAAPIAKTTFEFTHADAYAYGSNFFDVQTLRSSRTDPAAGGGNGATEVYAVYRSTLSLSKLTGKNHAWGAIRDWGLSGGFDWNTKNTSFAPQKRMFAVGPKVSFSVPGYWDLSVMWRGETNHNGLTAPLHRDQRYQDTYYVETAWSTPFTLGGIPMTFKGFANHVPPKGIDGFGNATVSETLARADLLVDIGGLALAKPGRFFAGFGYEYWRNKYGDSSAVTSGTTERAAFVNFEWHL